MRSFPNTSSVSKIPGDAALPVTATRTGLGQGAHPQIAVACPHLFEDGFDRALGPLLQGPESLVQIREHGFAGRLQCLRAAFSS